jgi:hypothetical protein
VFFVPLFLSFFSFLSFASCKFLAFLFFYDRFVLSLAFLKPHAVNRQWDAIGRFCIAEHPTNCPTLLFYSHSTALFGSCVPLGGLFASEMRERFFFSAVDEKCLRKSVCGRRGVVLLNPSLLFRSSCSFFWCSWFMVRWQLWLFFFFFCFLLFFFLRIYSMCRCCRRIVLHLGSCDGLFFFSL